jgi:hypothetical protein
MGETKKPVTLAPICASRITLPDSKDVVCFQVVRVVTFQAEIEWISTILALIEDKPVLSETVDKMEKQRTASMASDLLQWKNARSELNLYYANLLAYSKRLDEIPDDPPTRTLPIRGAVGGNLEASQISITLLREGRVAYIRFIKEVKEEEEEKIKGGS